MTGEVRSVKVRISVENAQAIAGVKQFGDAAEKSAAQAERAGARHQKTWDTIGRGARNTAIVGALALGAIEKANIGFDKQMSAVDAATHENTRNLALLRDAAIKAGADTQFSASEAAQGITELAKAGVKTQAVLGGGLKGALDLAAAGQISVAESAETAASAMTQFQLKGKDVPHIADLLAAGAGKAQGSVHDLGMALNQSGLVASQTGLSIEDTTGTLAAFAKAGLIGSDAGTSFKTMLLSLNPRSDEAGKLMKRYNIEAYDAQGNFVGITKYAGKLREGLKGLNDEQRAAALQTIFGTDAIRAANILYRNGAKGIDGWIKKVNDQGYAADTAARQTDNLAGDVERFTGSLESAFIKAGSGGQQGLRDVVQFAEKAVDTFAELPASVQAGTVKVLALTTGIAAAVYGTSKLVKLYGGLKSAAGALKGGSSVASVAGAAGVQKVYVVNMGAAGLGPGGVGKGGGPTVVGAPTKTSKGTKAVALGVNVVEVVAAANAVAFLNDQIVKLGDKGNEKGPLQDFKKQKDALDALLYGSGHTLKHDANAALNATKLGGKPAAIETSLAKIPGLGNLSTLPESVKHVKDLDTALAKLNFKDPAKGAEAYRLALKKSGLTTAEFNKVVPKTAAVLEKAARSQVSLDERLSASGLSVSKYTHAFSLLPAGVQKAFADGEAQSRSGIAKLTKQFSLTPIQVKALVALAGGDEALAEARRLGVKMARELDMTRKPKKNVHESTPGNIGDVLFKPTGTAAPKPPDLSKYTNQLKNIPAAVMTKISVPGAVNSITQVRSLARQYDLTPKQVRTLMKVLGIPAARGGIKSVSADANRLDGKKASVKVTANTGAARGELNSFAAYLAQVTRPRSVSVNVHRGSTTGLGTIPGGSADGSTVPKTGRGYADRHLYLLADGEEVISNRHGQADRNRDLLKAINANRLAGGGTTGAVTGGRAGDSVSVVFPSPTIYREAVAAANEIAASAAATARSAADTQAAHLDDLHSAQQIRDLTADLARREKITVKGKDGKDDNKKKKGIQDTKKTIDRFAVRGLDRTVAQAELANAKLARVEAQAQLRLDAIQAIAEARTSASDALQANALFGRSPAAAIRNVDKLTNDIATYGNVMARLKDAKASPALLAYVKQQADSGDLKGAARLGTALLNQPATLAQFNTSLSNLGQASGNVATLLTDPRFSSAAAWNPTTQVSKLVQVQVSTDQNAQTAEIVRQVVHIVQGELVGG